MGLMMEIFTDECHYDSSLLSRDFLIQFDWLNFINLFIYLFK